MISLFILISRDIWEKFRSKSFLWIFLMICNALSEGIVLALILPLLHLVGIGKSQESNPLALKIRAVFDNLGLGFDIHTFLLLIISISVLQAILFLSQSWLGARMQNQYVAIWRESLFSNYMQARWPFFVSQKSGHLMNTLIGETMRLGGAFYDLAQLISGIMVSLVYIILSFYASMQITLLILGFVVLIGILARRMVVKGYQIGKDISIITGDLQSAGNEFLSGAKVIKATSTEDQARDSFTRLIRKLRDNYFWSSFHPSILKGSFEFFGVLLLCGVLYVGTQKMFIDPAVIIIIIAIFIRLVPRLFSLQQNMQILGVLIPSISTVMQSTDIAKSFAESPDNLIRPSFEGPVAITMKNLSFCYGSKPILFDISMDVKAGKTTAIVGSSGSGKSTLVDCILRLYDPLKGAIKINGIPLSEMSLKTWRKSVGYVSQETFLFHDTIRNNILWGTFQAGEDILSQAVNRAYLTDFIIHQSKGLDTIVGDRGVRLSGGERQRIGLARALAMRPSLLILDEPTSALDSESEEYVLRAIEALYGQMTIITIAHRLSTVRNADYIYVLEEGKIVEEGTWDRLLENGRRFHHLWELQNTSSH